MGYPYTCPIDQYLKEGDPFRYRAAQSVIEINKKVRKMINPLTVGIINAVTINKYKAEE